MAIRLNWDTIKRNVDTDTASVIEKTRTDVDEAVAGVVADFEDAIEKRAEAFEAGKYDAELEKAGKIIAAQLTSDMAELRAQINDIKTQADTAATLAAAANGGNLNAEMKKLKTATTALKDVLDTYQEKVDKFGNTAGKLITGTVTKAIIGR